jgi:cysteinyl-tRNA synthetase
MLSLYNTLSRKLEPFVPINQKKVLFYHCGPTVYWTQHIGNLRGMTMGDLLVRVFRYLGFDVVHVRNYTDVGHLTSDADAGEDKMEKGAKREGMSPQQIAQKYIDIFETDVKLINLLDPTYKPRPSLLIPEIIKMVEILVSKGFAYTTDMAVYFNVAKFPTYTELSHIKLDKNQKGAGKAQIEDPDKINNADFALWVFKSGMHVNALQTWMSPFKSRLVLGGQGFPGWHIECSVMAKKYLGDTIDIHMGGVEHIPVHHTNEIAQSEAANGVKFVNYWLHNEHLVVNNEKMAKSAGTGMSLSTIIEKGFDPMALRYFYLTSHYRTRQNFSWDALSDAARAYTELSKQTLAIKKQKLNSERVQLSSEKNDKIDFFVQNFNRFINDDLNVPGALGVAWEMIKSNIPAPDKYDLLMDFDQVFGLKLNEIEIIPFNQSDLPETIKVLVKKRNDLRLQKKYPESDAARDEIEKLGYIVNDSPEGIKVTKK